MTTVYVTAIGQDDNIGDSLLRRGMLNALRTDTTKLRVFVGENSDDYLSGLGLRTGDQIYRSQLAWAARMHRDLFSTKVGVVLNAGETGAYHGSRRRWRLERALTALPRLKNAPIVQTGTGIVDAANIDLKDLRKAFGKFSILSWRDPESQRCVGIGDIYPDWGFAISGKAEPADADRDQISVVLRGDRPLPTRDWAETIIAVAEKLGVGVQLVLQVRRDEQRAEEVVAMLGRTATLLPWDQARTHCEQEELVRNAYGRSIAVISDRTHALIAGMTEGAVPVVSATSAVSARKAMRTIAVVDPEPERLAFESDSWRTPSRISERRSSILAAAQHGRDELEKLTSRIRQALA